MAVELVAEPEGGEELTAIAPLEGSRIKQMDEDSELKGENGETVYEFWLTAVANGELVKKLRTQVSKDAAKNANVIKIYGFKKMF